MKVKLVTFGAAVLMSFATLASQQSVDDALKNRQVEVAKTTFEHLSQQVKSSVAGRILQARIWLAIDETEQAYDLLEPLVKDNKDNVELQFRFGQSAVDMAQKASIFSKLGYAKEGRKAWERAVKLDPTYLPALQGMIGFHTNAPSIAGGDKEKAIEYIDLLKQLDPEMAFSRLVSLHRAADRTEQATATVTQGIKQFPQSSSLHYEYAMIAADDEQWPSAFSHLATAVTLAISDTEKRQSLYTIGKLAVESESELELDKGIDALTQLLSMDNPSPKNWSQYRLVQLYIAKKDKPRAQSVLSAIDDPDDELASRLKKLKRKLKKLK